MRFSKRNILFIAIIISLYLTIALDFFKIVRSPIYDFYIEVALLIIFK
jgi:hypothetical protein